MKILATFDRSKCSEAILPELEWMAQLPDAQFTFLTIARRPQRDRQGGRSRSRRRRASEGLRRRRSSCRRSTPTLIEDRGEAIARTVAERGDYLQEIVSRMPSGPKYSVEAKIDDDVACGDRPVRDGAPARCHRDGHAR